MREWCLLVLVTGCGGAVSPEAAQVAVDGGEPDAVEVPVDASPPWQLACFDGGGQIATDARSKRCQPMGVRADWCAGCAGTFAYSCWDGLPPASECAAGSAGIFCCTSNVCTRVEPTEDCPGQAQVMCSGAAPPAGCTQRSANGSLAEYCCPL